MNIIEVFILFLIGCFVGWIMEVLYLNLIEKKRKNPGFLRGPYLPIYGFAAILLYLIADSNIGIIYKIILFIIFPTLIELTTGVIFEKYFRIKLWDYSHRFLNYKGIICLQFSIYWSILTLFYYFVVHDLVHDYLFVILSTTNYVFFYGAIAGIFLLDVFYSFNIAFRIRTIVKELGKRRISFNKFKKTNDISNNIKEKIRKVIIERTHLGKTSENIN